VDFVSTRGTRDYRIEEVLTKGIADDGGLFIPTELPSFTYNDLSDTQSLQDMALRFLQPFFKSSLLEESLSEIVNEAFSFAIPTETISPGYSIMELFHGPTAAFKDVGARFLASCMSRLNAKQLRPLVVLVATSGDTGGAVAAAFNDLPNAKVVVLFPEGKVSKRQEKQLTCWGNNILSLSVKGTFDDCQKIVKELFIDDELQQHTSLTAINSINWARLMAQVVYYFWAYLQIDEQEINFIVPSGNFGNVFSANVAKRMGLPINQLHISTNQNDILHSSIKNGLMKKNVVTQTYSPSMDIQVSSNFERQLFESSGRDSKTINNIFHEFSKNNLYRFDKKIQHDLQSNYSTTAVSNDETLNAIKQIKQKYNYLADPHTSTGLYALLEKDANLPWVSLACAHPAKFGNAIEKATGEPPVLPKDLSKLFDKEEKMTILDNNKDILKSLILKNL